MEEAFHYTYCDRENREVLEIRRKYLPEEKTKPKELQWPDRLVRNSGKCPVFLRWLLNDPTQRNIK